MAISLKAAGAPAHVIAKMQSAQNTAPDVQPANHIIVKLFYAVSTQWEYAGMSGTRTGFDYAKVAARADRLPEYATLNDELKNRVWEGLQRMEMSAMKQWHSDSK